MIITRLLVFLAALPCCGCLTYSVLTPPPDLQLRQALIARTRGPTSRPVAIAVYASLNKGSDPAYFVRLPTSAIASQGDEVTPLRAEDLYRGFQRMPRSGPFAKAVYSSRGASANGPDSIVQVVEFDGSRFLRCKLLPMRRGTAVADFEADIAAAPEVVLPAQIDPSPGQRLEYLATLPLVPLALIGDVTLVPVFVIAAMGS